ncbi:MAG: HepT-like ribonuclease domain-containing protein [Coriobacteriia bacterium]
MPRSALAYLADIIDSCRLIEDFLRGVDQAAYLQSDEKRSAVERQFLIIGEAVAALRRQSPELAESISQANFIVGFRNVLAHDYASVDDQSVYATAVGDIPRLRIECEALLERAD